MIVVTVNARDQLTPNEIQTALKRHLSGDWGDCYPDDRSANNQALEKGERIFSVYNTKYSLKFWIITEADRSATTILMPEDY